ncbi:MAG: SgcJ/EcaC family oxidoreductase [Chloroflexi bacterium]|nr:SgcJ/EcaC family oxidoreductase [Chloroflexota bacterium]
MPTTANTELAAAAQSLVDGYVDAWNQGDGAGFARAFATDADFTSIRLDRVRGRQAIGEAHQHIFDTVYRGTRIAAQVEPASVRPLGLDYVEFLVDARMTSASGLPFGPRHAHAMVVAERQPEGWRIVAFHNMQPTEG